MDIYAELGRRIRKTREVNGWTQEQLAQAIRIKNSVLSQYENGRRPVNLEVLLRVSSVFRITLASLVDLHTDTIPTPPALLAPPKVSPRSNRKSDQEILSAWHELTPRGRRLTMKFIEEMVIPLVSPPKRRKK